MSRRPSSIENNHNPVYFRFIDLAIEKGAEAVFPVSREAATAYVQCVLKMVREEYVMGGEKKLRIILNIEAEEKRSIDRK